MAGEGLDMTEFSAAGQLEIRHIRAAQTRRFDQIMPILYSITTKTASYKRTRDLLFQI